MPSGVAIRGLPTRALACEAEVMRLGPTYQFRADTVTLSGGNVATIPNRRGSDALVLTAGTLAAPAGDILFGGAPSLAFTGAQYLTSNLAASNFRFLHNGTGFEEFNIFAPSILSGNRALLSTLSAYAAGAIGYGSAVAGSNNYVQLSNGTSIVFSNNAGALGLNTPTYTNHYFSSTEPINGMNFSQAAVSGSGAQLATPAAGDSNSTLILGATVGGANFANMRWCESLIFPRVLHEYERQIVREYIAARYAIAAPVLAGADRDIMSLLPFSWFDAAFSNVSAGKVLSFIDRARPGHLFAQATGANQVATPAVDAALNGQVSATFANVEFYGSSLAALSWRFFHGDGPGMESYDISVPTDAANAHLLRGTYGVPGSQAQAGATAAVSAAVYNSGGNIGNASIAAALVNGTAVCVRTAISSTQVRLKAAGLTQVAATLSGVPLAGDPGGALRIGGRPASDASVRFQGRYAASIIFNRGLTADEEARMDAATLTKYGKAA